MNELFVLFKMGINIIYSKTLLVHIFCEILFCPSHTDIRMLWVCRIWGSAQNGSIHSTTDVHFHQCLSHFRETCKMSPRCTMNLACGWGCAVETLSINISSSGDICEEWQNSSFTFECMTWSCKNWWGIVSCSMETVPLRCQGQYHKVYLFRFWAMGFIVLAFMLQALGSTHAVVAGSTFCLTTTVPNMGKTQERSIFVVFRVFFQAYLNCIHNEVVHFQPKSSRNKP